LNIVPHILLVDDDEGVRRFMHRTLAQAGYEVEDAANGELAVHAYRRRPSDLVITDIVMPDKEGLQTVRELRSLNPPAKIIAISGGGLGRAADYLEMAVRFGAARVLSKPFTSQELLAAVVTVLAAPTETD
jgi:DNA-binding response OmpR family regulator